MKTYKIIFNADGREWVILANGKNEEQALEQARTKVVIKEFTRIIELTGFEFAKMEYKNHNLTN